MSEAGAAAGASGGWGTPGRGGDYTNSGFASLALPTSFEGKQLEAAAEAGGDSSDGSAPSGAKERRGPTQPPPPHPPPPPAQPPSTPALAAEAEAARVDKGEPAAEPAWAALSLLGPELDEGELLLLVTEVLEDVGAPHGVCLSDTYDCVCELRAEAGFPCREMTEQEQDEDYYAFEDLLRAHPARFNVQQAPWQARSPIVSVVAGAAPPRERFPPDIAAEFAYETELVQFLNSDANSGNAVTIGTLGLACPPPIAVGRRVSTFAFVSARFNRFQLGERDGQVTVKVITASNFVYSPKLKTKAKTAAAAAPFFQPFAQPPVLAAAMPFWPQEAPQYFVAAPGWAEPQQPPQRSPRPYAPPAHLPVAMPLPPAIPLPPPASPPPPEPVSAEARLMASLAGASGGERILTHMQSLDIQANDLLLLSSLSVAEADSELRLLGFSEPVARARVRAALRASGS